MDRREGISATSNTPDRVRQILYDLTYIWTLKRKEKKTEFIDTENGLGGYHKWGWLKWVKVLKRYTIPLISPGAVVYSIATIVNNIVFAYLEY